MEKIKNRIQAVFAGLTVSEDGVAEIHYHEGFQKSGGKTKIFGFTAIVENNDLNQRLNSLNVGDKLEVETETTLSETELKTVLISFSQIMSPNPSARPMLARLASAAKMFSVFGKAKLR